MKYLYCALLMLTVSSCIKESGTSNLSYITNGTSHKVTILPFKNGIVRTEDTIRLYPGQTTEIGNNFDRGKNKCAAGFFSYRFSTNPNDSGIVVFDDTLAVSHYGNTPSQLARKYLLYTDPKNIFNGPGAYACEETDVNKHARTHKFTYTVTEQDYQFAKQ